jgi:hypothetical protein
VLEPCAAGAGVLGLSDDETSQKTLNAFSELEAELLWSEKLLLMKLQTKQLLHQLR